MQPPPTPPRRRILFLPLLPIILLSMLGWLAVSLYLQKVHIFTLPAELNPALEALQKRDYPRAERIFDAALAAHPNGVNYYVDVCQSCSIESWDTSAHRGRTIVAYAQRGLRACPQIANTDKAQLYKFLAFGYADAEPAHPQTHAIDNARLALHYDPNSPELLNLLGYLLADNDQDLKIAEQYISQALRTVREQNHDADDPSFVDSYGWVLYKQQNYTAAVDALSQAVDSLPDEIPPDSRKVFYYHLGAAYRKAGLVEKARYALERALYYDPNYAEAQTEVNALALKPTAPPSVPAPSHSLPNAPSTDSNEPSPQS